MEKDSLRRNKTIIAPPPPKMGFFASLKHFILSKFSSKYNAANASLVSYDSSQNSELPTTTTKLSLPVDLKLHETLLQTLAKLAKDRQSPSSSRAQVELIEIIEKTFSRQLDIFDELIQVVELDGAGKGRKQGCENHNLDEFVKSFVSNLITELINNGSIKRTSLPQISTETCVAHGHKHKPTGDGASVKSTTIDCECKNVNEKGNSPPIISVWPPDKR